MKAFLLTRYGPPEQLRLREVPQPVPEDHEVLVEVRATAVNDWDWCLTRGRPWSYRPLFGLFRPRVRIPGAEVAGRVDAVGSAVGRFEPGDAVYGDISLAGLGGFAEYVCVPETALTRMPRGMSFEEAAAIPHAAMLAAQGLIDLGRIRRGQRILINGAGGGVGTLGVQIARRFDAETTGVDSADKLETLRRAGFDHVIDYRQEDFTESGETYDLVLDTKSSRSPWRILRALNPGGAYVTVGGSTFRLLQTVCLAPLISLLSHKRMQVLALKPNQGLEFIHELFEAGELRCVVDGPYPLTELPQALRHFGEARHKGKVVVTVRPQPRDPHELTGSHEGRAARGGRRAPSSDDGS